MRVSILSMLLALPVLFAFVSGARAEGEETSTATFAMYCYWTGEATVGRVEGVERSRIGHWAGREIVQVEYDPAETDLSALIGALRRQRSFDALVLGPGEEAPEGLDVEVLEAKGNPHFIPPKHSLRTRHPELLELGLSEDQAIALNSWSYFGGPMPEVLTKEQKARLSGGK